MIGLDTNVIVRYIVQDDPDQSRRATRLIEALDEQHRGFVSLVVLCELHWVLRRAYKVTREDAASVIGKLLGAKELVLQEADAVRRALARLTPESDFSDVLISEFGVLVGCDHTATLDKRAARIRGMKLVP